MLESSRGLAVRVYAAPPKWPGDAAFSHTYSIFPRKNILLLLSVFRYSLQDIWLLYQVLCTDDNCFPWVTQSHNMLVLCGLAGIWAYTTPGLSVELASPNMKKTCHHTTVSLPVLSAILRDHTHPKGGHVLIHSHTSSNPVPGSYLWAEELSDDTKGCPQLMSVLVTLWNLLYQVGFLPCSFFSATGQCCLMQRCLGCLTSLE